MRTEISNPGHVFYRPHGASVGDVIPFYAEDEFKLFYLHIWRVAPEQRGPKGWYLLGSKDFVHYREDGPCHIPGGTGSVLKVGDRYHLFYCVFPDGRQIICHATSHDLIHWDLHPEEDFTPDPAYYEQSDWRDPLVFWNEQERQWWMLVAARARSPYNRSGCVGLCVSNDLKTWQARPPLHAPNISLGALECPDLFRMGDWWYLIYSTYTDRFVTQYRMSRTLEGPWLAPAVDTFDGRAFYAAKTGSDGRHRYLFGWNPTRTENEYNWNPPAYSGFDHATWDWGGHLIVHELVQRSDGSLCVRMPDSVAKAYPTPQALSLTEALGSWHIDTTGAETQAEQGFACVTAGPLPSRALVSARFRFRPGTRRLGLWVRASKALDQGYQIQFEPDRQRLVFKSYVFADEHGGKIPTGEVDLERPLTLEPDRTYHVALLLDDTVCEVYVNDEVALSTRMYDLTAGDLACYVTDGAARFEDLRLKVPALDV